jgi:hypothetical protein
MQPVVSILIPCFNAEQLVAQAIKRDLDHSQRLIKRLPQEVRAQRLLILERGERFLWKTSELTAVRRQTINDIRHQLARAYWIGNPGAALDIVRQIEESDASFCPSENSLSPPTYRLAYRTLGFVAETNSRWRFSSMHPRCSRTRRLSLLRSASKRFTQGNVASRRSSRLFRQINSMSVLSAESNPRSIANADMDVLPTDAEVRDTANAMERRCASHGTIATVQGYRPLSVAGYLD